MWSMILLMSRLTIEIRRNENFGVHASFSNRKRYSCCAIDDHFFVIRYLHSLDRMRRYPPIMLLRYFVSCDGDVTSCVK